MPCINELAQLPTPIIPTLIFPIITPVSYTHLDVYKRQGLYVKDSITGVGTLTYIDPNTKLFGALGHEIIEKNTGQKLEIKDGKIYSSTVTGVTLSLIHIFYNIHNYVSLLLLPIYIVTLLLKICQVICLI